MNIKKPQEYKNQKIIYNLKLEPEMYKAGNKSVSKWDRFKIRVL